MPVRFPAPLCPGDRIGITAPSSGVARSLQPRLEFCISVLRKRGFEVTVGSCLDGDGIVSAPAEDRAAEFMQMLTDPSIRAVVPPWGGELAVEVLPYLDFDAIHSAEPTWVVGYSDISTLLLPLTTRAHLATLHGQNLMDTPYRVPDPLMSWVDLVSQPHGTPLVQGPSSEHRSGGFDRWEDDPEVTEYTLDTPGTWRLMDPAAGDLHVGGRLLGGCIETISILAGTSHGDVPLFAQRHAPEGLLLYIEAAEDWPGSIARHLWRMRLAGWFDAANAVLVGRTMAPSNSTFTQEAAVASALHGLDIPVVLDVDCGHVPPHLALVNGALADLSVSAAGSNLIQRIGV